jgi:hypothetical protein
MLGALSINMKPWLLISYDWIYSPVEDAKNGPRGLSKVRIS